ncbi:MAG: hypothetical protein A3J88_03680 [Melioribacter sp. RIFOXYB12_FULL_38_5]|nr:MAG: hypothetical protein A3J88_03680 [Melioribacter sp. RIFOXYB12_FULL_38_5]
MRSLFQGPIIRVSAREWSGKARRLWFGGGDAGKDLLDELFRSFDDLLVVKVAPLDMIVHLRP